MFSTSRKAVLTRPGGGDRKKKNREDFSKKKRDLITGNGCIFTIKREKKRGGREKGGMGMGDFGRFDFKEFWGFFL